MAVYKKYAGNKHTGGHDAAMFQVLCKISRIACGKLKDDNYIDLAAYAAIAYECDRVELDKPENQPKIGGPEIQEMLEKNRHPPQTSYDEMYKRISDMYGVTTSVIDPTKILQNAVPTPTKKIEETRIVSGKMGTLTPGSAFFQNEIEDECPCDTCECGNK
jgi:hypothetical protein